ncbi:hypothetical protein KUCAC02_017216 [Chaenocephalus aceratus]|uniref:Uncharacterized protein n=1 Tax=Chaenocephalus aceratus TaxID=36190 RepID=A0ACB9W0K1_CHAAC|nr:hypothetical protein KUCAC02_017216 [Chaenocephalus aceratus]
MVALRFQKRDAGIDKCKLAQLVIKCENEIPMDKKNVRKLRNQDNNPCIDESDASQQCLNVNSYDKSMCTNYFLRYKSCRKYWQNIMVQRRREGVKPDMPTAAERQEMIAAIGEKPY